MVSRYRMALLQCMDLLCILVALGVVGVLAIDPELSVFDDYTGASLFTIFFYMLFFYILDAYSVGVEDFRDSVVRVLLAGVLAIISSATSSYVFDHWRFDRPSTGLLFLLSMLLCLGWRLFYYRNTDKLTFQMRVLLVGVDRAGKVRQLLAEGLPTARIIGYVGEPDMDPDAGPCLGRPYEVLDVARERRATTILLLPDAPIDDDIAHDLLEAKLRGRMVVDIRSFYEHVVQRLPISQINDEWLLQTEGFSLNTRGSLRRLKRAFDVLISLVLLVPAAPVMALTALLIRLARNIMCRDTVTAQDIEDVATEYFNVVCGRIARLIVQPPHSNSRFRIPRFHPGRYLPECDAASRWSIGYNNPENEGMKLIYMGPPSGGNPRS